MKKVILFFSVSFVLMSCNSFVGEEVARLKINELSQENHLVIKEATLSLKKGDEIGIWSDIDIEYEKDIALRFRIALDRNGEQYGKFEVDPTDKNMTVGELKSVILRKTHWKFIGKNSSISIQEDGEYTFKGLLVSSDNPSLKIKKAEVILKK